MFLYRKWKKFRPHHLVQQDSFILDSSLLTFSFPQSPGISAEKRFLYLSTAFSFSASDETIKSLFVLKLL